MNRISYFIHPPAYSTCRVGGYKSANLHLYFDIVRFYIYVSVSTLLLASRNLRPLDHNQRWF